MEIGLVFKINVCLRFSVCVRVCVVITELGELGITVTNTTGNHSLLTMAIILFTELASWGSLDICSTLILSSPLNQKKMGNRVEGIPP